MDGEEIELKFQLSPNMAEELRESLFDGSPAQQTRSVYFDTDAHDLFANEVALRVRKSGQTYVQAIKSFGGDNVFARREAESVTDGFHPNLEPLKAFDVKTKDPLRLDGLKPIFETNFSRQKKALHQDHAGGGGDQEIEFCLDVGTIRSNGAEEPICELELELHNGSMAGLFESGLELLDRYDLALLPDGKADRGYRLAKVTGLQPWKPEKAGLSADSTLEQAVRDSLWSAYTHFMKNLTPVVRDGAPETIHQMRVGLRRFRSVLYAFKPVITPVKGDPLITQVKDLFSLLGHVREIDVFVAEVLPQTQSLFSDKQTAVLLSSLEEERQRCYDACVEYLTGSDFSRLALELGKWIEVRAWVPEDTVKGDWYKRPLKEFSRYRLETLHEKFLKKGRKKRKGDFVKWHDLRILTKKVRYTSEFFATLHRRQAAKKYIRKLAKWQDRLGHLNDLATSVTFMEKIAQGRKRVKARPLKDMALVLKGWAYGVSRAEEADLSDLWSGFEKSPVFWLNGQAGAQ